MAVAEPLGQGTGNMFNRPMANPYGAGPASYGADGSVTPMRVSMPNQWGLGGQQQGQGFGGMGSTFSFANRGMNQARMGFQPPQMGQQYGGMGGGFGMGGMQWMGQPGLGFGRGPITAGPARPGMEGPHGMGGQYMPSQQFRPEQAMQMGWNPMNQSQMGGRFTAY